MCYKIDKLKHIYYKYIIENDKFLIAEIKINITEEPCSKIIII